MGKQNCNCLSNANSTSSLSNKQQPAVKYFTPIPCQKYGKICCYVQTKTFNLPRYHDVYKEIAALQLIMAHRALLRCYGGQASLTFNKHELNHSIQI